MKPSTTPPIAPEIGLHNSEARVCAVPGCERRAYKANPYCPLHTLRAQRHGDPAAVLKRGRKKKGC